MLTMSNTLGDIVYPFPFNQLLLPKGENVDPSLLFISSAATYQLHQL